MKRKWIICLLAVSATAVFSGCGTDLTEEESKIIADYAASTLLKYDMNYNAKYDSGSLGNEVKKKTEETVVTAEPTRTANPKAIADVVKAKTGVQSGAAAEAATGTQTEPAAQQLSPLDTGKLMGLDGIELRYTGMETDPAYPNTQADGLAFVLNAAKGYNLAVLKFELANVSDQVKACNIMDQNVSFKFRFNGSDIAAIQKTILSEDLSTMNINLNPGEKKQAVLICQVRDGYETTISSIDMIINISGVDSTINLK